MAAGRGQTLWLSMLVEAMERFSAPEWRNAPVMRWSWPRCAPTSQGRRRRHLTCLTPILDHLRRALI